MSTVQDKLVRAISVAVAQLGKGTNELLTKAFASFRELVHSRFGIMKREIAESVADDDLELDNAAEMLRKAGDTVDIDSQGDVAVARDNGIAVILKSLNITMQTVDGDLSGALKRYLDELIAVSNSLPWMNVDPEYADPGRGEGLGLVDIYTGLETNEIQVPLDSEEQVRELQKNGQADQRISAQEMINRHNRLVLLGDPGSGKSTFVNYLTHLLAQAGRSEQPEIWLARLKKTGPWDHGCLFPVRIVLRDFAASLGSQVHSGPEALMAYLQSMLEPSGLKMFWPQIHGSLVGVQPCLLLLDGLDEVGSEQRRQVVRIINQFADRYPNRYLITCRIYAYVGPEYRLGNFRQATLAPFGQEQIQRFVKAWYNEMAARKRFTKQEAEERALKLQQAVRRPDLACLAERPLLLTVMSLLHTFRGELPDDRVELYKWAVDLLLRRWEGRVAGEDSILKRINLPGLKMKRLGAALNEVAFLVHSRQESGGDTADISESLLREILAEKYLENHWDKAGEFVAYVRERAGLLIRHKPKAYIFPHRTFQEYLAACHLAGMEDYPSEAAQLVRKNSDQWRIVFVLAAGYTASTQRIGLAISAVNALCPLEVEKAVSDRQQFLQAEIAGEALLETDLLELQARQDGQAVLHRIQQWLLAAMKAETVLAPQQRVTAGNVLSCLGDPRFDPANWYLPKDEFFGFVSIPAGWFLMGSDPTQDKDAQARELPQHRVYLSEYNMGRYPVTVGQFRAFIDDTGYDVGAGWKHDNLFDNHPVVSVSWQDAQAYCHWLTTKLPEIDGQISLPTEAQWERAARGTEGRIFPWGNEAVDLNKANYGYFEKNGIKTTSPVGCYPGGKNFENSMEDLAGNVWEWCLDWYGEKYSANSPEQNPCGPDSGSDRVMRGGSWYGDAWFCRAALRDWLGPDVRNGLLGFRLVLPGQQNK